MEKIKLYQLGVILGLLLFSCGNYNTSSLESLSYAFNEWYLIQNPNFTDSLKPHNYYVKNNNMHSTYLNEYIFDLKRFRLELMQVNKNELGKKNLYQYNAIEEKINLLMFNYENFRYYQYNPSYYFEIINNHLLNLLTDNKITNINRNNFIVETLDLLPTFVNKISKNIIISNDLFIKKSNKDLQKTIQIIDNIPLYIESNDDVIKSIENKIDKSKRYLKRYSEWLNSELNTSLILDKKNISQIYDKRIISLEKKYNHQRLIYSLDLSIKNLQNKIFDLSLPIYLENNDEPIWLDREDTLDVINYIIKNKFDNKSIELDNISKVINFNDSYDALLSFIDEKDIVKTKKFSKVYFPDYDMFFDQDKSIFLSNNSYKIEEIKVLFNNSYKYVDDKEVYFFIINEILTKHVFDLYNANNYPVMYNDVNHYTWGKLLSKIIIQYQPKFLDSSFEIYHNIQLLKDFTILATRHKYINGNINKNQALNILSREAFINNSEMIDDLWLDILYSNNLNLEYYAAYIHISNLYDTHCIIDDKISTKKMIKKIFQYGFIPVYNYKSILN